MAEVWGQAHYEDTTSPESHGNFGTCTPENFMNMSSSGLIFVNAHGDSESVITVYSLSETSTEAWAEKAGGEAKFAFSMATSNRLRNSLAWIEGPWFEDNWKGQIDANKAIVLFGSCNFGVLPENYPDSAISKIGGSPIGYLETCNDVQVSKDISVLFERMGKPDSRLLGAAISNLEFYDPPLKLFGNGYRTLCPAPQRPPTRNFPRRDPVYEERTGFACVIFDTYMDDSIPAEEALGLAISGNAKVSKPRWIRNRFGAYALGFDYDKTQDKGAVITATAKAAKCLSKANQPGKGRQLDGNGEAPNGDDFTWET